MSEDKNTMESPYSEGLRQSLTPAVIKKVRGDLGSGNSSTVGNNILDIAAGFIPVIGLVKAKTSFLGYRDYKTAKKLLKFMEAFSQEDYNPEELDDMAHEIQNINSESLFENMMDILDRIDNANKAVILANILRHSIKGYISRPNYLRLCWIIANVPYIDLLQLHKYRTDFYEPSSTEILSANGLIHETVIDGGELDAEDSDKGGSKFGLSPLGEEMLHYGLYNIDWRYNGAGRQVPNPKWRTIK